MPLCRPLRLSVGDVDAASAVTLAQRIARALYEGKSKISAEDSADSPLLSVTGLSCALKGGMLWRGITFDVCTGDRLGLVGPSGSGKTLLLRTLAGLVAPAGGGVRFDGKSVSEWRMPDYRARVMYLAQRPALSEGTVEAALEAPFAFRVRRNACYPTETVAHYLQELALDASFLGKSTEELSGGESQLVALLRAMILDPVILLLDEPTASLDAARVAHVERLLRLWMSAAPRACIWTSHDPRQLKRVSNKTLTLGSHA